jgi:hypothetical protein
MLRKALQRLREGNPGGWVPILRTARNMALETGHFFLHGLHKGDLKVFSKGGLGQYVYWARNCIDICFCYV